MQRKKILILLFSALFIGAGLWGAHAYLKSKIEKAIYASLSQYDVSFNKIDVNPFRRRVVIEDLEVGGFLKKPQNRLGAGKVTISDVGLSSGKVSSFHLKADLIDLFIEGWISKGSNQSVVYHAASLKYQKTNDDIILRDIAILDEEGLPAYKFSEINFGDIKKKDGLITSLTFSLKGLLEDSEAGSIKQYALQEEGVEKRPTPEKVDSDPLPYALSFLYERDLDVAQHILRALHFGIPRLDLTVKADAVKWSKKVDGVFPTSLQQSVEGFQFFVPLERLQKIMEEENKNILAVRQEFGLIKALGGNDIQGAYKFSYDFDREDKSIRLDLDLDLLRNFGVRFDAVFTNIDPSYVTSVDEVFFVKTIELKDFNLSYMDHGLMEKGFAFRAEKNGITEEKIHENILAAFDEAMGPQKTMLKMEAHEAIKTFLKNKNSISFSLRPRLPISVGEMTQLILVSPSALATNLNAKIVGK